MKYPDLTNQLLSLGQTDVEIHSFDNTQTNKPSNLSKLMGLVREISVNPDNKDKIEHLKNQASSKAQVAAIEMYTGSPNRFINFYGPPGTISTVPYHSVLKGYDPNIQTDSFNFANKIVFIGYSDLYDPGQPDRFYTVFTQDDGVDLSGVEIAATAFGNLVTNTSLRYLDTIITALFLLTFGLIIGSILILFPAIVSVPIAIICSLIYLFLVQYQFNYNYTVYSLAIPLYLQAPLIIFIGLASQYILERKKGQRVIEAINYYLPEHIARDLAQNKLDEDKLNQVVYSVCMATDMAGFSKISEELPPDKLAIFLNSYFESLAAPLHKHGVNVTEFRADAIMCAWTSDTPSEEIRRKAILASIDAAIAINEFQKEHSILKAKLRIGLEVGHVYIGHAGGGGHFVYSIVGESANTASRVEGLKKVLGTQILATEGVLESIDNLLTRYLGDFIFVGKTEALPVYEIIALKENASHAQTDLCNSFNTALSLYHNRDWKNAAKYFNDILSKSSEDGPAKYYYDKCIEVLSVPESIDDPKVIKLNSK